MTGVRPAGRGGPQGIPRPPGVAPGEEAPWAFLPEEHRRITIDSLRTAYTGRVGAASVSESNARIRPSAVLACFWEHEGEVEVLLTRRSAGLRAHSGEVAFPGGRSDPGETLLEAALREAEEEVGLDPGAVEVLGELDHLTTVSSRAFIVPLVAVLPGRPEGLVPNPGEVDAVLLVPTSELLAPEVYREERWVFETPPEWAPPDAADLVGRGPVERSIFFFELVGDTVWGATAAMLRHCLGLALDLGTAGDHV